MPTQNKTANLNLNSWLGTDKPKREDFVSDNTILDNIIHSHTTDTNIHLTEADRQILAGSQITAELLQGDGKAIKSHTLSFAPSMVIVLLATEPFTDFDFTNNCVICNGGIGNQVNGSTSGMELAGTTLILSQSQSVPTSGPFLNLNKQGEQYVCIEIK